MFRNVGDAMIMLRVNELVMVNATNGIAGCNTNDKFN